MMIRTLRIGGRCSIYIHIIRLPVARHSNCGAAPRRLLASTCSRTGRCVAGRLVWAARMIRGGMVRNTEAIGNALDQTGTRASQSGGRQIRPGRFTPYGSLSREGRRLHSQSRSRTIHDLLPIPLGVADVSTTRSVSAQDSTSTAITELVSLPSCLPARGPSWFNDNPTARQPDSPSTRQPTTWSSRASILGLHHCSRSRWIRPMQRSQPTVRCHSTRTRRRPPTCARWNRIRPGPTFRFRRAANVGRAAGRP